MAMDRQGRQKGLQRPAAARRRARKERAAARRWRAVAPRLPLRRRPRRPKLPRPAARTAASGAAKPTGVDKELEEKARKAEEAEKAKRAAEEQKVAQAKAENCQRARQGRATLDSGIRVARLNEKGEREIMDDKMRAAEQQRMQTAIESDCK